MLGEAYGQMDKIQELDMTFDKWVDAVNAGVRTRLGADVRTEELSWDSAIWVSATGTAVASVADDAATARLLFDGGENVSLDIREAASTPEYATDMIVQRLSAVR
jgi:hypothetical protein